MGNGIKHVMEDSSDDEDNSKPFYSVEKILSVGATTNKPSVG